MQHVDWIELPTKMSQLKVSEFLKAWLWSFKSTPYNMIPSIGQNLNYLFLNGNSHTQLLLHVK